MVGSGGAGDIARTLYPLDAGGLDVVRIAEPGWQEYRSIGAAWRQSAAFADLYAEVAAIIADEARGRLRLPTRSVSPTAGCTIKR